MFSISFDYTRHPVFLIEIVLSITGNVIEMIGEQIDRAWLLACLFCPVAE